MVNFEESIINSDKVHYPTIKVGLVQLEFDRPHVNFGHYLETVIPV